MRKLTLLMVFLFVALFAIEPVIAVNIGISPGAVVFSKMLRGGYSQHSITLSSSVPGRLTADVEVYGEIKDWVKVATNNSQITMIGNVPYKMKVVITPPSDIQAGNYTGVIRIITDKLGDLSGGTGSVVKAAVSLQIRVEIVGQEILSCNSGGFSIHDVEFGYPIEVSYLVENTGNVRMRPHLNLEIWDQLQENLLNTSTFVNDFVLQTEQQLFSSRLFLNLPIGQYWVKANIPECQQSVLLTFSVLEKGAIADTAELLDVRTRTWVNVGEIVPIIAVFQNNGERSVLAQFRGKVSVNDKVLALLQSDEVRVDSKESANITMYFTPKVEASYLVTGRVKYNQKYTFEKGSVINARATATAKSIIALPEGLHIVPLTIFVVILLLIIFILSRIRRKRRF